MGWQTMNERIKECWLKAAREDSSDKWDTQEEFIERFAKLIVRECALTAGLMEHEGRNGIGAQLLDNFGVEE